MVKVADLIQRFEQAYDEKWGYILGTRGQLWQKADQEKAQALYQEAVRNNNAKSMDRWENAAKYGGRWVGKHVSDCSGLFVWAFLFDKVGIAHGSNSIWNKYLSSRGTLTKGKRSDGQTLKPGTAVFRCKDGVDYYHIGLYIGNGYVIEAQGTQTGVVKAKTLSKWTHWGELKDVIYESGEQPMGEYENAVVTASSVNFRAAPSKSAERIGPRIIKNGENVQARRYNDAWSEVQYQGVTGYAMTQYLTYTSEPVETSNKILDKITEIQRGLLELKAMIES